MFQVIKSGIFEDVLLVTVYLSIVTVFLLVITLTHPMELSATREATRC
jgi:hypothetical protein